MTVGLAGMINRSWRLRHSFRLPQILRTSGAVLRPLSPEPWTVYTCSMLIHDVAGRKRPLMTRVIRGNPLLLLERPQLCSNRALPACNASSENPDAPTGHLSSRRTPTKRGTAVTAAQEERSGPKRCTDQAGTICSRTALGATIAAGGEITEDAHRC